MPSTTPKTEDAPPTFLRRRGLRFVLLAHPAVQAARFFSKVVLAWLLTSEDLGEVVFASLFALAAAQVAIFGLDEALIHAPRLDLALWRSMRAFHARIAIGTALALAAAGLAIGGLDEHPRFGTLLCLLAPMVALANFAVLPTALLVRAGAYPRIFALDLAQVAALTLATWASAALGAGAYSLVIGWYANALAAVVVAHRLARPHVPADEPGAEDAWPKARGFGAHLCGASLATYAVERVDGFAIGARIGRAALGLYDLAQQLSTAALGYAANLVERLVFPVLADEQRAQNLGAAWSAALRIALVFLLPLHVLLAAVGEDLVLAVFPERWNATGPLLVWLALAAGARALDLVASATLKAGGHARAVSTLGWTRLLLLAAALAAGLPRGLEGVAMAVCAGRTLAALASTWTAMHLVGAQGAERRLSAAVSVCVLWSGALAGVVVLLHRAPGAPAFIASVAGAGVVLWTLARLLLDRAEFARELAWLRGRIAKVPS